MSSKRKPAHHGSAVGTAASLRPRVDRAVAEGRFQQALELAKQLYKYEPTPAHLELLRTVYLGRARQLHSSGYDRDAATTLEAAIRIDPDNSAWLEQVATEMAVCGAGHKALELLEEVPSSSLTPVILARAADVAVQQGGAGKAQLPPALHAEFDRVLQAFQQVEAGQDDAAKETLQGIGLKSPFLEWKLFLRGLQAYYQKDDARALENWSRLDAERVPARLAAPFRYHIDPAFRAAQKHDAQAAFKTQFDRLQSSATAEHLRSLRAALADTDTGTLTKAFRQAEALLPALRIEAPHLIPRLAACCYWAVLETGPDDILRYKRVFGAPRDDPQFHRIEALANERAGYDDEAHRAWQAYEKEIAAAPPSVWALDQGARARALIWMRMGKNAASIPSKKKLAKLPRHLRNAMDFPEPLKPTAEQCFEHSIALAPDLLEPYEALFAHHQQEDRPAQAEKAGRKLLERFPDHVPTLTALGHLLHRKQEYPEALALFQRALKVNPLNRDLRSSVSVAHVGAARLLIEAGTIEEARTHLQAALALNDNLDDSQIRCRWAALEFKAGNLEAAEEQLRTACLHIGADLPVAFRMLTEVVRLKLDKKLKSRFDKEVKEGFASPPTPRAVVGLLGLAASLKQGGISYYGQKTHEKKIQTWADKARSLDFTEAQFVEVIIGLIGLDSWKSAERYAATAEKKYKDNPEFPVLHARILLRPDNKKRGPYYRARPLLERAERLVRDLPKEDSRKERLAKEIAGLQSEVQLLDPWGSPFDFPGFFDSFGDDDLDDNDF